MAVITVTTEPGTLGEELAARIAGHLGFVLVDDSHPANLWQEPDQTKAGNEKETAPLEQSGIDAEPEASFDLLADDIVQMAEEHDLLVIGNGAQGLFHNLPGVLHVRLVGPRPFRIKQLQAIEGLSARQARSRIRNLEAQSKRYLRNLFGLNWADPCLYDITLRMDRLSMEQALKLIEAAAEELKISRIPRKRIVEKLLSDSAEASGDGRFVNAAEKEFAAFLDFYCIPYEYEPRTFPLETDPEGNVIEAFTPDFYLPEQNLFIELTTMKQSLVTRKNRKVRKLRRLYPDVNVRLFYRRDFLQLMAKYGIPGGENVPLAESENECRCQRSDV